MRRDFRVPLLNQVVRVCIPRIDLLFQSFIQSRVHEFLPLEVRVLFTVVLCLEAHVESFRRERFSLFYAQVGNFAL